MINPKLQNGIPVDPIHMNFLNLVHIATNTLDNFFQQKTMKFYLAGFCMTGLLDFVVVAKVEFPIGFCELLNNMLSDYIKY